MPLINTEYDKYGIKRPLKKSKTGMEIEMHVIDNQGSISNKAPEIIKQVEKDHPNIPITKEIGKSMIEFGCFPTVNTISPALDLINSVETTKEILNKKDLHFYPFATYPGRFQHEMSDAINYKYKEKIFGDSFPIATKVVGFHHHYTLPKGVYDSEKNTLRLYRQSKLKKTLISSYNFETAIDPILTLFTQSSPFYEGKHLGKDSRMIVYRGGKKFRYPNGLYANLRSLGHLSPYIHTQTDLMLTLRSRQLRMKKLIKKADKKMDFDKVYPVKLDIGWNPVKINKHGTLEQRGMDMNLLSILFSVSAMIKYGLRKIQREYLEVIPQDFGEKNAFKIENGIMHIPAFATINNKLQKASAFKGFDDKRLYNYAKRFLTFSKSILPKKYIPLTKPIIEMVDAKKTVSDKVYDYAKKKGYVNEGSIYKENAKELALYSNDLFEKDLKKIKKKLQTISNL